MAPEDMVLRQARHRGQTPRGSLRTGLEESGHRRKADGAGGGLEGELRSCCLMRTELQFGKMKKFRRWRVGTAARQCECA